MALHLIGLMLASQNVCSALIAFWKLVKVVMFYHKAQYLDPFYSQYPILLSSFVPLLSLSHHNPCADDIQFFLSFHPDLFSENISHKLLTVSLLTRWPQTSLSTVQRPNCSYWVCNLSWRKFSTQQVFLFLPLTVLWFCVRYSPHFLW